MMAYFDLPIFRLLIVVLIVIMAAAVTFHIEHQARLKRFRRNIHRDSVVIFKSRTNNPSTGRWSPCRLKGTVKAVYGDMVSILDTDEKVHYVPISHILKP